MLEIFSATLYLALPAFIANMIPIVAAKINILPQLNKPFDHNHKLRNKRILGDNKTYRGLVLGTFFGGLTSLLQYFFPIFSIAETLHSTKIALAFGACAGFGALIGDALASTIKRQLNIASGKPCIPLDQIDYILGFLIFTQYFANWNLSQVAFLLIFALIANPLTNLTAYVLGIKKTYW